MAPDGWETLASQRGLEPTELVVVLSSETSPDRAEALARHLLEQRLVACVSMLPVRSLYHWQGALESSEEVKLLLKTSPGLLHPLRQALLELHSYAIPEWIVLQGSSEGAYAAWLSSELRRPEISPGAPPPAPAGSPGDADPAG
ncbi:MAG: divalent-cation tolerance protein CutA [Cyanobium sp.]